MKKLCTISFLIFALGTIAQPGTLKINIEAPFLGGKSMTIKIGSFTQTLTLDGSGRAQLSIERPLEGSLFIEASAVYGSPFLVPRHWSASAELNGSGVILCKYANLGPSEATGIITIEQWPAVTWKSSKDPPLEVYMDTEIQGNTTTRKGISPDVSHTFLYKRNGATICDTSISFPYNVKKTCTCDVDQRHVIVQ
jgi:hypothetical protein